MPSYKGIDDTDVEDLRKFLEQEVIFALHVTVDSIYLILGAQEKVYIGSKSIIWKNGHEFNKTY